MNTRSSRSLILASLLLGAATAIALPASARTREREGTYTDDKGHSGTIDSIVTNDHGDVTKGTTVTNQKGQTVTTRAERKRDKASGTGTFSRSTTGPNGKSASTDGTWKKNSDGSFSTEATRTGFNGKTETIDTTTTKTDAGATTTGTITGQNGKQGTISSTAARTADGHTRDTTLTGPNGRTNERVVAVKKNTDGTYTRTIETTKPDGTKSSRTENYSVTLDPTGK